MSREESDDETSNGGSGTDSGEEDEQKVEDEFSRSEESSSGSESDSGSDATESGFMMLKNDVGDKRDPDEPPELQPPIKKVKTLGGKATPVSAPKTSSRHSASPKIAAKKQAEPPPLPPKKQSELQAAIKKEETPKKTSWTSDQEHALVQHIFEEMKSGSKPPKRGCRGENYHYWNDVHEACQGKFITDWTKDQLYDKYRRMKIRYDGMVEKERAEGVAALKFKNPGEEKLYNLWKEMYEMQEQEEQGEGAKVDARRPGSQKSSEDEAGKKELASSSKQSNKANQTPGKRQEVKQNGTPGVVAIEEKNPGFAAAVQELQRKYNTELGEMKGKFEEMMNQLQVRSSSLASSPDGAGSSSAGMNGLNEWFMLSMAARSSPLFNMEMMMPHMFGIGASGGLFAGLSDPAAMKLKENWLKQQEEELRVMEQRLQLLQTLCHHQQDMLRKQQPNQ